MIKALRKYLLTLCIVLLTGFILVHAGMNGKYAGNNANASADRATFAPAAKSNHARISYMLPGRNEIVKICSEKNEDENENPDFFRAYASFRVCLSTFYTRQSARFGSRVSRQVRPCQHWFYSSSHRYVSLRVIRI